MVSEEILIEKCIEHGANKAFIINVDEIPFDENLRSYCKANYCGNYGKNYACPPGVGESKAVIAKAKEYKKALIFQTITDIEDSYDFEGMVEAKNKHTKVANAISEDVKSQNNNYLQLVAGECTVCSVCAEVENKPCRFPDKAISSLEAYCMNVALLAELCNMKYINGKNTVTYFGAFLFQ